MARQSVQHTETAEYLTGHITSFTNVAFGRRLRPSRALRDAIMSALEDGYSQDEIRIAFWTARCLADDSWFKQHLSSDIGPELVLRHKGGINPRTGQPAKRWLDEFVSRASEMNGPLIAYMLSVLPEDMRDGERALLARMGVETGKP